MLLNELFDEDELPNPGERIVNINDSNDTVHEGNVQKLVNYIKTKCSDSLLAMGQTQTWLYRGFNDGSPNVFLGNPRGNRPPKDLDIIDQEMIDNALRLTGFSALRSNSMFATSRIGMAASYGSTFNVFPLNGFKFTSSSTIRDLWVFHFNDLQRQEAAFINQQLSNTRADYYNQNSYDMSQSDAERIIQIYQFFHDDFKKSIIYWS